MSYLPDHEIKLLGERLITPFRPENVEPASVDLCLSDELMVPRTPHNMACVDLNGPSTVMQEVSISKHGFVLHPGEFALGCTEEMVTLPDNIVGKIVGKSSLERFGLAINLSAGWIDPGFRGRVTFGMLNMLRVPIVMRAGKKCCQITFAYTNSDVSNAYEGRYQDSETVVASRYPEPRESRLVVSDSGFELGEQ